MRVILTMRLLLYMGSLGVVLLCVPVHGCSSQSAVRVTPNGAVHERLVVDSQPASSPSSQSRHHRHHQQQRKEGVQRQEAESDHSHSDTECLSNLKEGLTASPAHNEQLVVRRKSMPTEDLSPRHFGSMTNNNDDGSVYSNDNSNQLLQHFRKKPLSRVLFSNTSIQCNDGTTSGYYVRESHVLSSDTWIVFLEGGWFCTDERSCHNRWLRLRNLMSSSAWPSHKYVGGILSPDPNENPYWWNANHVFVPYCSSDTWSGTSQSSSNGSKFNFMGALIIDEVIKSLIQSGRLRSESTLILAGSSAGATGVLINLDRIEEILNEKFGPSKVSSPRVRGIADSGWFIDKLPSYTGKVNCHEAFLCPPDISLKKGMSLWHSRLPQSCQSAYPDEPWSCFLGYRIYPTLKASLFVFQWLFDEAQMLVNNVPTPAVKKEEWDYVYRVGNELKKTLSNVTNVFIPACMAHTVLTHKDWRSVEVNSVCLPRALKCWESGGMIEESNFIPLSRSSHKYWEGGQDSSLLWSNKLRASRRHESRNKEEYSTIISSNDSSRRNRRRHNRRRHRLSKKERRKRRKKRQKKRHNETFSEFSRKRRRKNRRQSNPELFKVRRSNQLRRKERKNRRRRWFSVCDASGSGVNSAGDIRLIEKCSWPQCNKSCPKLLNPVTGEEVDFKDLLKSFGLDMETMAKALGIDLATLNSMDHQVLLQMLTQNT